MIQSELLKDLGIAHGYSTRTETREKFFATLGVNPKHLVVGEQVHGTRIAVVKDNDKGKMLPGTDGLVSTRLPIGVQFADCVPILAVDPKAHIIGTAHAGWKGTLDDIAKKLIFVMETAGADIKNISVSIGPSIGMCCYNVLDDRAAAFQKRFGENEKIAARIGNQWHINLACANFQAMVDSGVLKYHIDVSPLCTSCRISEFNSYRKDPKEKFGVQMGVISL